MAFDKDKGNGISIPLKDQDIVLSGSLYVPDRARGLILFAHGSGSGRFSPRNRFVAQYLNRRGYATLLFDLLTRSEEAQDLLTAEFRFDIELLAGRLDAVTGHITENKAVTDLPVGYFGASTGAAAALVASVNRARVRAIVSRGGRPDMAEGSLKRVTAPTLLIVGGDDYQVIELNKSAFDLLEIPEKKLEIVTGATHLFEEPGALDEVAALAAGWFEKYLS